MQDVQNIPNPDVNYIEDDGDFGSHSDEDSDTPNPDVDQPNEKIPVPPDRLPDAPIEEPPAGDGEERQRQIV